MKIGDAEEHFVLPQRYEKSCVKKSYKHDFFTYGISCIFLRDKKLVESYAGDIIRKIWK